MSETKHTPGPWATTTVMYDNYPTVQVWAPFYSDAVHWRKPKAGHTRAERDQQNADAHLIAAAPDQNEELLKVRDFLWSLQTTTGDPDGTIEARLESINRVLAKAAPK